jgi:hypothetical protein
MAQQFQSGSGHVVPARAYYATRQGMRPGMGRGMGVAPLVVAGVQMAATAIVGWISSIRKKNLQKTAATQAANEAEYYLQQNLDAWNASGKTRAEQVLALESFDKIWAWLISTDACGNPNFGSAGQRCISERQAGGTVPGTGGNWFVWYRDPIADDPGVVDTASASTATGTTASTTTDGTASTSTSDSSSTFLLLALALGAASLWMFQDHKGGNS